MPLSSTDQMAARRGSSRLTDLIAATLFLALGVGLVLHPYATGRELPGGDLVDPRFNFSMLEFFYRTLLTALQGGPANFLDAPFFYPWPRVTNFSDTHWGDGLIYVLARSLGIGPLASFQAWFVAGFALTYVAAFVSLRKLGLRTWGAAAGAFLFTFPLPMAAQFGHAQLVYRLWVPPAVLMFDRLLTRRSLRGGAACVLFVALQLAASIYIGLFLLLLLAAYAAALWLVARSRLALPLSAALRSAGVAELVTSGILLAVASVVLAIVGIPYLDVQSMYGFTRSWAEVADMLPRPGSYLLAGPSKLWPNLESTFAYPIVWEHKMFPGMSAIIALAWLLFSKRGRTRQPLATPMLAAVAILFVVTIDVGGYSLYRLIFPIPGFSAIRAVARIILVMMLPLAALLGMLIDDLTAARAYCLPRALLAVALSAFVVAECSLIHHDALLPSVWRARFDALEARLPKKLPPHAVLAIAAAPPKLEDDWDSQVDAIVAAATLGISTLNGYSGNFPPKWRPMTTCRDIGVNLREGRHFLTEHGVPEPDISPKRLVLVGFGRCDPVQFTRDTAPFTPDPTLQLGRTYHFAKGAEGNQFLADGFSAPESWGRWTDAKSAFLFFTLDPLPPPPLALAVDADSLSTEPDRKQVVSVVANGHACGQFVVTKNQQHAEVTCPAGSLHAGDNMLRLNIAHPTRPVDLGINADHRQLGLGLRSLALTPKE